MTYIYAYLSVLQLLSKVEKEQGLTVYTRHERR